MSKIFTHNFPLSNGSNKIYSRAIGAAWNDDFDSEELDSNCIKENTCQITCVPLITYGLNRHDIVETSDNGYILTVIKPSGHSSIRVLLFDHHHYIGLVEKIAASGLDIEFNSHTLFGIDLPNKKQYKKAIKILKVYETQGVLAYEINSTT